MYDINETPNNWVGTHTLEEYRRIDSLVGFSSLLHSDRNQGDLTFCLQNIPHEAHSAFMGLLFSQALGSVPVPLLGTGPEAGARGGAGGARLGASAPPALPTGSLCASLTGSVSTAAGWRGRGGACTGLGAVGTAAAAVTAPPSLGTGAPRTRSGSAGSAVSEFTAPIRGRAHCAEEDRQENGQVEVESQTSHPCSSCVF